MMKTSRDVIADLLLVYASGEASDDTHQLVAAFAANDAEIARLLAAPPAEALPQAPYALAKENEMQTLERTKTYIKWHTILLGGASFLTFVAVLALALIGAFLTLSRVGEDPRRMIVVAGVAGLLAVLTAAAAWTGYFVFRHSYRVDLG